MARIWTTGFELRTMAIAAESATAPDGAAAQGVLETTIVRSGSASLKCLGVSGGQSSFTFPTAVTLGNDCFLRSYIYVPTGGLPSSKAGILDILASTVHFTLALETDGTLTLWTNLTTQQGSASPVIAFDTWQMVDLRVRTATGALDQIEGRLGGDSFASASGLNISDNTLTSCAVGIACGFSPGDGTIYHDDVAANDSSGSAQTSWPGNEKIVLLRPAADSAVGTGWTLGNTTATGGNAWQRLDDAPPNSATDLTAGADTNQIRNATSNANVNYDGTMTTYSAAGIAAVDTVNVIVPIIATGAPVTTNAKAGTVGVASNPAIANISLGPGGTSGAFWSGATMGAYPTGNKWSYGTTTYAPSVTVGTAPVMRVTQVTSSTRIAIVTEMGMYVSYTPHPALIYTPFRQASTLYNL